MEMIYQMTIYYGALLNGRAIYSIEYKLEDCRNIPKEFDENYLKNIIEQAILKDGFELNDFEICYLTKEQYEDRYDTKHEKVTKLIVEK